MTINIITILGARPQFVKAAALSNQIRDQHLNFSLNEKIIHTGQHYSPNMSDNFFLDLNITKPFKNLGIGGGTHGENTGRMIEGIEKILIEQNPDGVVV